MSFAVHFFAWRLDGSMERTINPFTKEPVDVPGRRLSAREAAAVIDLIERAHAQYPGGEPADAGRYCVQFPDGASAEIDAERVERDCSFTLRGAGVTPMLAQLLFDVMVAGNWQLVGEDSTATLVPTKECAEAASALFEGDDDFKVVLATSALDVARVLSPEFAEWSAYRDAVLAKP
jgi:hypothetical protein